jgi:hypothetical protein
MQDANGGGTGGGWTLVIRGVGGKCGLNVGCYKDVSMGRQKECTDARC